MTGQPIIFVLNGPNLNLLGEREPNVYGGESLGDIRDACARAAKNAGFDLDFRQSNHEGDLVGWIHEARDTAAGIAINAGGYTHSSVAIHDALRLLEVPVIEVHLSNVFRREAFRHHSYVAAAATGVICGLGADGYVLAIEALARRINPDP